MGPASEPHMTPVECYTDNVSLLLSPHTFPQAKNNSVPAPCLFTCLFSVRLCWSLWSNYTFCHSRGTLCRIINPCPIMRHAMRSDISDKHLPLSAISLARGLDMKLLVFPQVCLGRNLWFWRLRRARGLRSNKWQGTFALLKTELIHTLSHSSHRVQANLMKCSNNKMLKNAHDKVWINNSLSL